MPPEVDLVCEVDDAYEDLTRLPRSHPGRLQERTIFLEFEATPAGYSVRAHGPALPYDGNAPYKGLLRSSHRDIAAGVAKLHDQWADKVVRRKAAGRYVYDGFPAQIVGAQDAESELAAVCTELARAGQSLYRLLFLKGDSGLKRLEAALAHALRSGPQTITVTSEDLFVPWGMLYLHPDPGALLNTGAAGQWTGFLGYTHIVEHNLGCVPDYDPFIHYRTERPRASLHFDTRLENRDQPDTCPLQPVRNVVETHADCQEHHTKPQTSASLIARDSDHHVLVFGAHGTGVRTDRRGDHQAKVVLSDNEPIYADDIHDWACDRGERLSNPLCFMMVCEGGRVGMYFQEGLARPFFELGVGCVIGPQIEVNTHFASRFTCRFFEEFFKGECAAPVMRHLTQEFISQHATPLGLAFTLVRGIDSRLIAETGSP
ncbi:CHAT domain-containing protein [Streptomyces sp. SID625]|nr:CHAT domain-containing protein [Streptomyces sp. SID625]